MTTVDIIRYYVLLAIFLANTSVKADNNVGFINGTLSVNELGAAVYTVPLEIYPSGTGFDPQIGIAYNSQQSGYGNVGYGTNITGISCITRAGKDLFHDNDVQKVKYEAGDNYLLDGKRLYLKDGKQGTDGSTYTVEGNPYAIVTLHGNDVMSSTSVWFELKDVDGTVFQYGKTLRCNFGYPSASYKNVAWYITKSTNKYNDCITYAYSQEDNYMYPTTIAYGREGERHAVIFSYYNLSCPQTFVLEGGATGRIFKRLAYVTSECSSNIYRKYSLEYALSDASGRKYDRLKYISVANGKNETLKPITFDWEYLRDAKISIENRSVPELKENENEERKYLYAYDINGDGISDIFNLSFMRWDNAKSYPAIKIYLSSKKANSEEIQYQLKVKNYYRDWLIYKSGYGAQFVGNTFCNIDGDNYLDYFLPIYAGDKQIDFQISSGERIINNTIFYNCLRYVLKATTEFPLYNSLDLNFDGKDEIIYVEQKKYNGYFYGKIISNINLSSQKEATANNNELKFSYSQNKDIKKMFLADCNADGLQDILLLFDGGYKIYFNNGGKNLSSVFSESNTKEVSNSTTLKDYWRIEQGDFNGDGLIDFVVNERNESKISFLCNNGNGTFTKTGTTDVDFIDIDDTDKDDRRYAIRVADFDKDGRSDIMISKEDLYSKHDILGEKYYRYNKTQIRWYKSDGTKPVLWQSIDKNRHEDDSNEGYILTGDFDGDGYAEIANYGSPLNSEKDNTITENTINIYSFPTNVSLGRVSRIYNGGKTTNITYSSGTNPAVYTADYTNESKFPVNTYTLPLPLVSEVSQTNGAAGTQNVSYSYGDLKVHVQGRGLMGFSKMTVNNTTLGSVAETKVESWDDSKFIPTTVVATTSIDNKASTSRSVNNIITASGDGSSWNGNYIAFCKENTNIDFDGHQTKTLYEYDTKLGVPTSECTFYDGNDGMYKKSEYQQYVNQSGQYVPKVVVVTQKHPDDSKLYTVKNSYAYDGLGNVLENVATSEYDGNTVTLTAKYTRDSYGNVESEIVKGDNVKEVKKFYEYDDIKLRLKKAYTNPTSVATTYEYDSCGNLTAKNDISDAQNILTTAYEYDNWGQVIKTTFPDGTQTCVNTTWSTGAPKSVYKTVTTSTGKAPVTTYYDREGREVSSSTTGLDGVSVSCTTTYNEQGLQANVSQNIGMQNLEQSYTYDKFGRITSHKQADGASTSYEYNDRTVTTKAPTGTNIKTLDAWGNVVESTDKTYKDSPTVSYIYNSIGKPVSVTSCGNSVTIKYDGAGRKTELKDPDAGTQTYTYAANGTLLSQTDGRGITTAYTYDNLGRQIKKVCGDEIQTTTYGTSGNALNRVISEECNNGMKEEFEYDNIGRVVSRKRTNGNRTFRTTYNYNNNGQLESVVYPGDVTVKYTYDSNGYMVSASANGKCYFKQGEYNGLKKNTVFGNLTNTERFYNNNGLTAFLAIENKNDEDLDRINYTYYSDTNNVEYRWRGAVSNDIKKNYVNFIKNGGSEYNNTAPDWHSMPCEWEFYDGVIMPEHNENYYPVENFEYDNLDRLWYVSKGTPENPGDWEEKEIQFDSNGNILNKTGIGSYKYNAVQPHAVSEIEPQTNESGTMNIMPHHIEYNDEGKVSRIYRLPDQRFRGNGPISSYIYYYYGPNTEKWESVDLKSINERIITAKTIYYFDNYEYVEDNSPYEQYFLENGVILIKKDGQLNFYQAFCDNQGSILSVFDEEGNKVFDASYDAWGKQTVTQNDIDLRYGYCGHEMLNEFGLINMTGRIYDPEIGRFISCDNFVQQPDNTQNFNRYTYCLNNPMKYVDPDGENFLGIGIGIIGTYLGGAMANNWQMNPAKWSYSTSTFLGMGLGALTGGVGGTEALAGMASINLNVVTPYAAVGVTYGGSGTPVNGWCYSWATAAGGGGIISRHGYSAQYANSIIDAKLNVLNQEYKSECYAYAAGLTAIGGLLAIDYSAYTASGPVIGGLVADDATGVGAIDDVLIPVVIAGATIKFAYDNREFIHNSIVLATNSIKCSIDRAWQSIERMSEKTRPCRPGYVYHLVAREDGLYRNVRTNGLEYLKRGETWKIGETINGEARYSQEFYRTNNVRMEQRSDYYTDKYLLWCAEKWQMINYYWEHLHLPIGNKLWK